jgi:hypothetical protein
VHGTIIIIHDHFNSIRDRGDVAAALVVRRLDSIDDADAVRAGVSPDVVFAFACPVCYAPADPIVRESANLGIFVLLGVTTVVLAGVIRFMDGVVRRSSEAAFVDVDVVVSR